RRKPRGREADAALTRTASPRCGNNTSGSRRFQSWSRLRTGNCFPFRTGPPLIRGHPPVVTADEIPFLCWPARLQRVFADVLFDPPHILSGIEKHFPTGSAPNRVRDRPPPRGDQL